MAAVAADVSMADALPPSFGARSMPSPVLSNMSDQTTVSLPSSDEPGSGSGSGVGASYRPVKKESMLLCAKDKIACKPLQGPNGAVEGLHLKPICCRYDQPMGRHCDDWVSREAPKPYDVVGDPKARLVYGEKASPGYRSKMEDRTQVKEKFMTLTLLTRKTEALIPEALQWSLDPLLISMKDDLENNEPEASFLATFAFDYVAVFDGHGGTEVAERLAGFLHDHIEKFVRIKEDEMSGSGNNFSADRSPSSDYYSGKAIVSSSRRSFWNNGVTGTEPRTVSLHDSFKSQGRNEKESRMEIDMNCIGTCTPLSEDSAECWDDAYYGTGTKNSALSLLEFRETIQQSFLDFDENLPEEPEKTVGSTAVVSLISALHIVIANVGDSRAVLRRGGSTYRLSRDHKPDEEDEESRIRSCGGRVWDFNGRRVMGLLAMTRAFGDDCLKDYGICAKPEVTVIPRSTEDEFLILACDGLWDVVSDDEACQLVKRCFKRAEERDAPATSACRVAASVLFRAAFAKGSNDNISVVVVDLRHNNADNNE